MQNYIYIKTRVGTITNANLTAVQNVTYEITILN